MNVTELSDYDLEQLRRAVQREQAARRRADTSPERIEEKIAEYQKAQGRKDGDPWEQPVSALDAYPKGATVTHDDQQWRSLLSTNVWEPPTGWRLVPGTDEDGNEIPPPYVAPSGSHDAYAEGERITWTDGEVYEAVRDGVVHSPAEYAPDWKQIIPATPIEPAPEPEPEPEPGEGDDGGDEPAEPEEPEEDQPEEWVQPGGHNPYNTGDRVLWQGSVYESVMDGNVWSPTGYPQGWTKVS